MLKVESSRKMRTTHISDFPENEDIEKFRIFLQISLGAQVTIENGVLTIRSTFERVVIQSMYHHYLHLKT